MAPVIAARAKHDSSYVQGVPTANSLLASMSDFDKLWRGNLSYNSDRWAKIKTAENRFQRPSVMPRKPRILSTNAKEQIAPEAILEDGKTYNVYLKYNRYDLDNESEEDEETNLEFIRKARKSLAMSHPATMSANPENIPSEIAITAYESKETLNSEDSSPP